MSLTRRKAPRPVDKSQMRDNVNGFLDEPAANTNSTTPKKDDDPESPLSPFSGSPGVFNDLSPYSGGPGIFRDLLAKKQG